MKQMALILLYLLMTGCIDPPPDPVAPVDVQGQKSISATGVYPGTETEVYFGHYLITWTAKWADNNGDGIMQDNEVTDGEYYMSFNAPVEITWNGYLEWEVRIDSAITREGDTLVPIIKPYTEYYGKVGSGNLGLSKIDVETIRVLNPAVSMK